MKKLALALLLIAFGIALGLFMNRTDIQADRSVEKKKIASMPEAKAKANPAPALSPQPTMLDNQSQHDWLEPQDSEESSAMQSRQVILHPVRSEPVIITTAPR